MRKLNYIRNEKGMALITVLMVFLVLVILLGAAMFAAVINQRNAILANEHSEAYYIAESGINLRVSQIEDFLYNPGSYIDLRVTTMHEYLKSMIIAFNLNKEVVMDNGNKAIVTFSIPVDAPDFFDSQIITVTSKGIVNGVTRTLRQDLVVQIVFGDKTLIDKAIVSRGSVMMSNNSLVVGAVMTNGEKLNILRSNGTLITGPIFELWDVSTSTTDNSCLNISAYGWPNGLAPELKNIILKNESLADKKILGDTNELKKDNCFRGTSPVLEPAKIFPAVVVPDFPVRPKSVSIVGNKIVLPDLSRIKDENGNSYDGYVINGNLDITTDITVELGSFGYSSQLKRIWIKGDFITSKSGSINVTGQGRLVFMKDFGFPYAGQVVQWDADVNSSGQDPAKVIFMLKTDESLLPKVDENGSVEASFAEGNVVTWSISNNAVFNASLISENVNYEWSNAIVKGYIITNGDSIKLKANAETTAEIPVWIYAPVAQVNLESGNKLYGSVLAKSVEFVAGNPEVIYEKMPPGAQLLSYMFYLQPATGGGTNPDKAIVYFSNIIEIDNE